MGTINVQTHKASVSSLSLFFSRKREKKKTCYSVIEKDVPMTLLDDPVYPQALVRISRFGK